MTQFQTLFTLSASHAYYSNGCRDFDYILPLDAVRMLGNIKALPKIRDGKLYVLFEADEAGDPLLSGATMTLRIGLKLNNPFFSNFTVLDFDPNLLAPLYKNSASPNSLGAPQKVIVVGGLFHHPLSKNTRPVTVTLKDQNNTLLQTDTIVAAFDRKTVSYDLTLQSPGLFSVEEVYPAANGFLSYYSDPQFAQAGIFGIVEIKIRAAFYTNPPDFEIAFEAKQETLKYYVVARNFTPSEFNSLAIADAGFADDGRPQVNFTKVLPAAFTDSEIPANLLSGTGIKLALFKSQGVVARQENPRKKIQLKKNNDVLIDNLPQPGVGKTNSDLIIQLSK